MRKNRRLIVAFACLLICLLLVSVMAPATCSAKEKQTKTVRVAYAIVPGFQEGGKGEYKTGYGYEYLQKLAAINGWKYEYVYGSFNQLLKKLQNGKVDLMGNLSFTEERAKTISYSENEQGKDDYYLYVNKKHNTIDPLDDSSLNGKRIGVCTGEYQSVLWEKWCKKHNVDCELVEYDYLEDCEKALNSGKIDALIGESILQKKITDDWEVLFSFASSEFYFGVSKKKPSLLSELNAAQGQILEDNPMYNEEVKNRYVEPVDLVSTSLSAMEKNWLEKNKGTIKVGYLKGFPPLCYQDEEGEFKGVAADTYAAIEKQYAQEGISFEPIMYDDYRTMFKDLNKGKISVAWPAYDDYWYAEQNHFTVTDRVVAANMMLVYDGNYTDDTVKKIGVINTGSLPRIYGEIYYPDSQIKEYDSYEDAIDAVLDKEVSSVLYVSTTYNVDVAENETLQRMNMITLPDSFGISFAVTPKNKDLVSILNKGIKVFGEAGVNHSLTVNSSIKKKITIKDYFAQHPYVRVLLILLMAALVAGIIIFIIYKNMSVRIKAGEAEKELYERLANSDVLTGLQNRRAYENRIKEIISQPYKYANAVLIAIDISGVKHANDYGGRPAGDKLIMLTAAKLSQVYGADVYRVAGDNFAVFDLNNQYEDLSSQRLFIEMEGGEIYNLAQGACPLKKADGTYRSESEWKQDVDIALYNDKLQDKEVGAYTEEEKLKAFVFGVSAMVDAKDSYTANHSERVRDLSVLLAKKMGLSDSSVARIKEASELHDLGKIGINDAILQKPGRLTEEEFVVMKSHPAIGADILRKSTGLLETSEIVRHHHERFDGKGYPDGLAGEDIPIESRIIAVADSIDAMTSSRCYREALPSEVCYEEIKKNLGVMYDPAIGRIALENWNDLMEIVSRK